MITKTEVLNHVNKELDRSETDTTLKEHLLAALKWLSLEDDFLWVETTVDTIIGRPYYSLPLDYKDMIDIKVEDNKPLDKITWGEYQSLIANQTSANYDLPRRYALHGGFWYAYPTPDAEYEVTIFYPNFILESEKLGEDEEATEVVDAIPFKDIYREAIYAKTKAIYCRFIGLFDDAVKYELELKNILLPPLKKMIERVPKFVKNTDL